MKRVCITAGHGGRAVLGMNCLRSLGRWDRGFEFHSPVQGVLPLCKKRLRNWRRGQGPTKDCRTTEPVNVYISNATKPLRHYVSYLNQRTRTSHPTHLVMLSSFAVNSNQGDSVRTLTSYELGISQQYFVHHNLKTGSRTIPDSKTTRNPGINHRKRKTERSSSSASQESEHVRYF
jgi:hypothetical protein